MASLCLPRMGCLTPWSNLRAGGNSHVPKDFRILTPPIAKQNSPDLAPDPKGGSIPRRQRISIRRSSSEFAWPDVGKQPPRPVQSRQDRESKATLWPRVSEMARHLGPSHSHERRALV